MSYCDRDYYTLVPYLLSHRFPLRLSLTPLFLKAQISFDVVLPLTSSIFCVLPTGVEPYEKWGAGAGLQAEPHSPAGPSPHPAGSPAW